MGQGFFVVHKDSLFRFDMDTLEYTGDGYFFFVLTNHKEFVKIILWNPSSPHPLTHAEKVITCIEKALQFQTTH